MSSFPRTPEERYNLALTIVKNLFKGDVDKIGEPYVDHLIRVSHDLATLDYDLMTIGLLHDVLEDKDVTIEKLRGWGFTERIIAGVVCLTRPTDSIYSYMEYIDEIVCGNFDAVLVKMADIRDNTNIDRVCRMDADTAHSMGSRYRRAYVILKKALDHYLSEQAADLSDGALASLELKVRYFHNSEAFRAFESHYRTVRKWDEGSEPSNDPFIWLLRRNSDGNGYESGHPQTMFEGFKAGINFVANFRKIKGK